MDFCICQPVNRISQISYPNTLLCDMILAILLAFQIMSTTSNILTSLLSVHFIYEDIKKWTLYRMRHLTASNDPSIHPH